MWPWRLAQPGPALLGARARRGCDYTPAAGHNRRPLGLGAAAPQFGRPHPGKARGPPGSQPLPSCGRGVIFHYYRSTAEGPHTATEWLCHFSGKKRN